ncbi:MULTISPECIES: hypothetical protein [Bacillaceae]|uniref:Uncharacterized protein n=1 Tax=Gottfriedia luciferensis TaxID=178774 RepID=A0ABX2ZT91_9BACI|nr:MULTISPECIES: hypothetical protein [Bacillaceae]ODG92912.1 hypothetical protein BED47_17170 [Gottfriedia luciferensis]PGZ93169.1 hypothetical protein COE53_08640 [Bacillus sp. AFS029533]SFD34679.1 hypothetical protein SAMN02799633_03511 [Bacillus sp. UNCCL81]
MSDLFIFLPLFILIIVIAIIVFLINKFAKKKNKSTGRIVVTILLLYVTLNLIMGVITYFKGP